MEGVAGGFATGVLSARAQWEALARPSVTIGGQDQNNVNYDGVDFWLTRSKDASGNDTGFRDGYPWGLAGDASSYPSALTDQMCVDLMDNLLQNPPKVGIAGSSTSSDSGFNIRHRPTIPMPNVPIFSSMATPLISLNMK